MSSYFHGEAKSDSPFTRAVTKPKPLRPPAATQVAYGGQTHDGGLTNAPATIQRPGDRPTASTESTPTKTNPASKDPKAGQSIYDLSTDPIVQRIRALGGANYEQAVATADAGRKQLLIDSGFSDLARATQFGGLETPRSGDEATALAAQNNPFSIAASLKLGHDRAQQGIDQTDNNQNLFFSSTRANHLGDEAHQYLGNVSSAQGQLRQKLTDIVQSLLGVKSQNQQAEADAFSQARQNAINNAIASGESFVGYDNDGNPVFAKKTGQNDTVTPDAAADPKSIGARTTPALSDLVAAFQVAPPKARARKLDLVGG